jgi:hypothetical protein
MTEEEKWQYLVELDERLLQGAVILSEWAAFLVRDTDTAFASGAYLASIISGLAGIETHLRAECYGADNKRLVELIEDSDLEADLKEELQELRKYRNRWVHVSDPWNDEYLLETPEAHERELEGMAQRCAVALRRTLYANPWV